MTLWFDRFTKPVLDLPRRAKRAVVLGVDVALCLLSVWLAYYLRIGEFVTLSMEGWKAVAIALLLAIPIFVLFGLHRAAFRYVSYDAMVSIARAHVLYGLLFSAVITAWGIPGVPRTVGIIQPLLLFVLVALSRAFARYWLGGVYRERFNRMPRRNVLIYGAGSAGQQLLIALTRTDMKPLGFIDDEPGLQGTKISGVPVWSPNRLAGLVRFHQVSEIFLAIPSATRRRRNEIIATLKDFGVAVRTLPGLLDLATGSVSVNDLKELEVEDLLGRDPVQPDEELLRRDLHDHVVMVTGAGGSIGSELCRQILTQGPKTIVLVEANEFALYTIDEELRRLADDSAACLIVPLLASVSSAKRMRSIFATYRPQVVYHAAAYKHVPLVESNVVEGVHNNVVGTYVCAKLADEFGAVRFILVSTDKAVRPTNVMGASKRLAEIVLQGLAQEAKTTRFAMVRFGNVLGSSGSVVPRFRKQIAAGGPVTVTHRDVIRYFMTIPEAVQLVLQAGAMAKGGEVYVLDMGEPVSVYRLAIRMIELSGLRVQDEQNPDGDIPIKVTGLRPGEKLYEELLIGSDPEATSHPRIMMAKEKCLPMTRVEQHVAELRRCIIEQDIGGTLSILFETVPEFQPSAGILEDYAASSRNVSLRAASVG